MRAQKAIGAERAWVESTGVGKETSHSRSEYQTQGPAA